MLGVKYRALEMVVIFLKQFYSLLKLQLKRFCLLKLLGYFLYNSRIWSPMFIMML